MRRLALHASALSDSEYEFYTTTLRDISLADDDNQTWSSGATDDTYFEKLSIGVREARAWLRGRYSHLPASTIDKILKLFSPDLSQGDTISGSEFFAAIRLVVHAESGKKLERSLAFVQADPSQVRSSSPTRSIEQEYGSTSRASSPAKRFPVVAPMPSPTRRANTDFAPSVSHNSLDSASHNPFSMSDHPQPPLHPSHRSESSKSLASTSQHSAYNPFVHRPPPPRSEDGIGKLPPLPPRKPPPPIPPQPFVPPPRHVTTRNRADRSISPSKPPNVLPASMQKLPHHVTSTLMKQSLQASKVAKSMKKAEEQLEKERVMQVLKSSSVVSGTNIHNQHHHRRSTSPSKYAMSSASSASDERAPPLPRRRNQPSPPMSTSSLEQVALAAPPNFPTPNTVYGRPNPIRNMSPFRSPTEYTPPNNDSPEYCPPPTHPDRKPYIPYQATSSSTTQGPSNLETFEAIYGPVSASSSLPSSFGVPLPPESPTSTHSSNPSPARAFRSRSMHQTSPPLPPLPPPARRKRPESVQVLGSGAASQGSLTCSDDAPSALPSSSTLSRHSSLSTPGHRRSSLSVSSTPYSNSATHAPSHTDSPLSNIQRTIATLQPKLDALHIQPRFDKARYKAEAGLSRRGFVSGGRVKSGLEGEEEEGLVGRGRSQSHWIPSSRNGEPEGGGNIFDDPSMDSDGFDDDVEGNEKWTSSHGMDSNPVREIRGRQGVFYAEEPDLLSSGGDDGLGVDKDNLKWPAGEGWKPL